VACQEELLVGDGWDGELREGGLGLLGVGSGGGGVALR